MSGLVCMQAAFLAHVLAHDLGDVLNDRLLGIDERALPSRSTREVMERLNVGPNFGWFGIGAKRLLMQRQLAEISLIGPYNFPRPPKRWPIQLECQRRETNAEAPKLTRKCPRCVPKKSKGLAILS